MDGQFSVIGNHEEAQFVVFSSIYVLSLVSGIYHVLRPVMVSEECDDN
jgi:hypothetical protein